MYWRTNSFDLLYCYTCSITWSETKPTVSLRYACTHGGRKKGEDKNKLGFQEEVIQRETSY